MPQITAMPATGVFNSDSANIVDIKGSGKRTLFAWGDFAGGTLKVRAVIPHPDGDQVFHLDDEVGYISAEAADEVEVGGNLDSLAPRKILEMTSRGFMTFDFRSPVVRLELTDCDDTPDLKYWIG